MRSYRYSGLNHHNQVLDNYVQVTTPSIGAAGGEAKDTCTGLGHRGNEEKGSRFEDGLGHAE